METNQNPHNVIAKKVLLQWKLVLITSVVAAFYFKDIWHGYAVLGIWSLWWIGQGIREWKQINQKE